MKRSHHMSFGAPDEVNFVVLKLTTQDGYEGWGEAATLGGPGWSSETAETIQVIIERYLVPKLVGQSLLDYQSTCLLYTSPSPRDKRQSRMPSSA